MLGEIRSSEHWRGFKIDYSRTISAECNWKSEKCIKKTQKKPKKQTNECSGKVQNKELQLFFV